MAAIRHSGADCRRTLLDRQAAERSLQAFTEGVRDKLAAAKDAASYEETVAKDAAAIA